MTAEFIVAVHTIVYLNHMAIHVSSDKIAENVCTNPARVRKVMIKLKQAGLVISDGKGYAFAGDAGCVTLRDILDATDRHIADVSWRSGNDCAECPISRSMKPIMDTVLDDIDDAGRSRLAEITVSAIDAKIFNKTE